MTPLIRCALSAASLIAASLIAISAQAQIDTDHELVATNIAVIAQTDVTANIIPDSSFDASEKAKLLPSDLLANSAARFPDILESLAKEQATRGDALAAQGAFDLVFSAEGYDRVTGFWSGAIAKTEVRKNLRNRGAQVYGGYRISDGTFPIYEDINFTNTLGEFKVGALFSLLRDKSIDQNRFRVTDARLANNQANLDVVLTKVGVQQQALQAYWRWLAAGHELLIYRDLLQIAKNRQSALEIQVREGAQADITLTENMQNLIRREILVAEAERSFLLASNQLSFFIRDGAQNLVTPSLAQLPPDVPTPQFSTFDANNIVSASSVLSNRPELARLQIAIERAQNKITLSENNLKPKLDLNVEISRDFGSVAQGGISRDSTDTIIGFKFSVPLERSRAKGRLQRARAELNAVRLREQRIEDQITVELENVLTQLITAKRLVSLASREVEQAGLMVAAERKRLELGASDFFLVNIREERAADAQIRSIRAKLNGRLAQTSYNAATLNMDALGLGKAIL